MYLVEYVYLIRQFDVEYGWIFVRVTLYFDEPLPTNSKQKNQRKRKKIKEKNLRIKYKVLENCATKREIWLYIFTRSQSYSRDILYELDNKSLG